MTVALVPDIEKLIRSHIVNHASYSALNTRVVGKTPDTTATSWVRLTKLDSPAQGLPDRLIEFMVQLDCYAGSTGGQPEAITLARTIRSILSDLQGTHADGVVTGVQVLGGPRQSDTSFEPAREREILTVIVWAHS